MSNQKPTIWVDPNWALPAALPLRGTPQYRHPGERGSLLNSYMRSSRRITRLNITLDIWDNIQSKRYGLP